MGETANSYTVVVTQERAKTVSVLADSEAEAEVRVREMLRGDYGGWTWKHPKVVVVGAEDGSGSQQ